MNDSLLDWLLSPLRVWQVCRAAIRLISSQLETVAPRAATEFRIICVAYCQRFFIQLAVTADWVAGDVIGTGVCYTTYMHMYYTPRAHLSLSLNARQLILSVMRNSAFEALRYIVQYQ